MFSGRSLKTGSSAGAAIPQAVLGPAVEWGSVHTWYLPAVLAESEKGWDGPEATLLVEDREQEGGSPRSPCPMAPESDRNPGYLASSLAVWSEPVASGDCQA